MSRPNDPIGDYELLERYGMDTVLTATGQLMDYTERVLRQRIAAIPDGEYRAEGFLDDDGRGQAFFNVKAGKFVGLEGLTIYHAFVTAEVIGIVDVPGGCLAQAVSHRRASASPRGTAR